MSYQDKFYSKYVSAHTGQLYGELSLEKIKRRFPAWRKYFGKFLPENKEAKIIDLGCGNGGFVWWLQEVGYRSAEGIDISPEQVELAEKLGIENIQEASIEIFLKNKVKFYDTIFIMDVLEHKSKESVLDTLELIWGSLKEEGVLIIQTSNAESPFGFRIRYADFTHEISFTKDSIKQILTISGFKRVKVFPVKPAVHGLISFIRLVLWDFIDLCLRFYLLIETGSAKGIFTQGIIVVSQK